MNFAFSNLTIYLQNLESVFTMLQFSISQQTIFIIIFTPFFLECRIIFWYTLTQIVQII